MAWNTTLVERLRYYIHDFDSTSYTYTDSQLEKFLAISAINVLNDLGQYTDSFTVTYTVNTQSSGSSMITPDPVDNGPMGFTNMMVASAACMISRAALKKTGAEGGWKIVDDYSTLDGTKAVEAAKESANSYCSAYQQMLSEFKRGNQFAGHAVLAPYSSSNGNVPPFFGDNNNPYRRW